MIDAMSQNDSRGKIIQRVRSLRARAANEASSETEVAAAASRAAKLISENELSETELREEASSGIREGVHNEGRRTMHPAMKATSHAISMLCETSLFWKGGEVEVIGFGQDVEFALYLCELIQAASERAWKKYLKRSYRHSTAHMRTSFLMGFGEAVYYTLSGLTAERIAARNVNAPKKSGALVALKGQLIQQHIDVTKGGIKQFKGRVNLKTPDIDAAIAGLQGGTQLTLNRPITSDEVARKLEATQ